VTWLAKQINSRGLSLCAVPSLTERETIDLRSAEVRRLERSYGVTGYVPGGRSELGEDRE
jgi:hypothetical protein